MRWFTIILLTIPLCWAEPRPDRLRGLKLHPLNRKHYTCISSNPGASFRNGCNWCVCARGRVKCTKNFCSSAELENLKNAPKCRRGRISWYEQCNECLCRDGSSSGGCTKINCPDNPKRGRRSSGPPALLDRASTECQAESRDAWWRVGCVFCRCSGKGILCSREECLSDGTPPTQTECVGNVEWQKDICNTCLCNRGNIVCSDRICGPASPNFSPIPSPKPSRPECEEGTTKRRGCNECVCISGRLVCTRKVCAPAPHPDHLTVCDLPTHLEKADGCRALIRRFTYEVGSQDCVNTIYTGCGGTENLFRDINTCRAACGVKSPTQDPPGSAVTPAVSGCTEGSVAKRDCNTCVCREGRLRCTNRYCSNQPPKTGDICLHPPIYNPILNCQASFIVWTYSSETQECRQLEIQGCTETNNNFPTLEICQQTCRHLGLREATEAVALTDPRCLRRPVDGACPRVLEPRYLFDQQIGRCVRTYTSSCGDMTDSFGTLQQCQFTCIG